MVLFVRERHFYPIRGTINACFSLKTLILTTDIGNKNIKKVVLFVRERHFYPVRGTINACFLASPGVIIEAVAIGGGSLYIKNRVMRSRGLIMIKPLVYTAHYGRSGHCSSTGLKVNPLMWAIIMALLFSCLCLFCFLPDTKYINVIVSWTGNPFP